jgi:alpha-tubulin suppressor-like RCC1 family protein
MRSRPLLFSWLAVTALGAGACNLVFGIDPGVPTPTGNTGGAQPDGGTSSSGGAASASSSSTGSTTGTGGSTPCVKNTATCEGAVLHVCDGTGHPAAPVTCPVVAACDAAARACIDGATLGRLAVGTGRACAIEDDRTVRCWGQNGGGGLILSDPHWMVPTAQPIAGVTGARQITVAGSQQCVLQDDGTLTCWGANDSGELGIGATGTRAPFSVPGIGGVVEVSAAQRCTCARLADGTVTCWGEEASGCLGLPSPMAMVHTPTPIAGVTDAVQLRAGGYSTPSCARQRSGKVLCWNGDITPTAIPGVDDALDVAVGFGVVFIRSKTNGVVWSAPTPAHAWSTAASYGITGAVTSMSAGDTFVAVRDDGSVLYALLDGGSPPNPAAQMTGQPAGTTVEVAAGAGLDYDTGLQCLRLAGTPLGTGVHCWGDDEGGALGADAPDQIRHATDVPNLTGVASVTTAQSSSYVVHNDGTAAFWGTAYGFAGSPQLAPKTLSLLGNGNRIIHDHDAVRSAYIPQQSGAPTLIDNGLFTPTARLLSGGFSDYVDAYDWSSFDVGRRAGGTVVVYASAADSNAEGIFGDGTITATPDQLVTVPGISAATAIAAYTDDYSNYPAHVCAIVGPGGGVSCWGGNHYGEIGVGIPGDNVQVTAPAAVQIPGNEVIVSIAAGRMFTCAASAVGHVFCWGTNDSGQLGSPGTGSFAVPLQVPGLASAVGVSARDAHVCAWLADKTAVCWGDNSSGQLGDGTFDNKDHPVVVTGLSNVAEVSAGPSHTCARRGDGTVACWGSSHEGQVGTGVIGVFATPRQVLGL